MQSDSTGHKRTTCLHDILNNSLLRGLSSKSSTVGRLFCVFHSKYCIVACLLNPKMWLLYTYFLFEFECIGLPIYNSGYTMGYFLAKLKKSIPLGTHHQNQESYKQPNFINQESRSKNQMGILITYSLY